MKRIRDGYSNLGKLMILIGVLIIVPIGVLPFYPEDAVYWWCFMIPGIFSIGAGALLCLFTGKTQEESLYYAEHKGNVLVLFVWLYSFLIGAVPFMAGCGLTFSQACFESVSGWTTTGLSVVDVTVTPHIFLFYRSFMQFCGGLGFVMIMTVFIRGKFSMQLYQAEGHSDKIMPALQETVRVICAVYVTWLFVGIAAYVLCGMPVFDSILHTMGALSTGGFSNRADSIGAYGSFSIEMVTILLMLVGTTNFLVLVLMAQRKWNQVAKNSELHFLILLLLVFTPVCGTILAAGLSISLGEGMRQALFNIVSALSTTGYSTMPYTGWPQAAIGIMILMQLIGGGIGSTAGGIKLARIIIMLKAVFQDTKKRICGNRECNKAYYYRAQGKMIIGQELLENTTSFIIIYVILFVIGTLAITICADTTLIEAMFEFSSSLGTVGLSIGLTGTQTQASILWIEIAGMILGRLEIFLVIAGGYSAIVLIKRKMRGW